MSLSVVERIDRFGQCCWCAAHLLTKRIVDGKVIDMFLPTYDHTFFLLNSGSQMQVTICKTCKETMDLSDKKVQDQIMQAVYKGWELETKVLIESGNKDWTKEKRDVYLKQMSQLSIDCQCEYLDKYVLQQRQFELLKISVSPIEEAKLQEAV